ncbi:Hypothetical predicted protein [Marmota monax]|uniref:Lysophospholipid acyltransferase 1 n=1 Tax=Marmota monax TaxID=9995 RepID=A0A5E4C4S7_MARMO|nr:hypothetical protein GHT09_010307 [Marmota monax]VTJ76031.1 Hypothetical predicted protein [Marmota monax]
MAPEPPPPRASYRTTGSTCLHPLSELLGIPLDQVNFVACQLFALLAALWFRLYLHPAKSSSAVRHAFATILGTYFVIFCFGWYSVHLFVLVLVCYGIMVTASVSSIHRYTFFVAMGYLTICHISRIYIFHYGVLTTDFSGPLMIITQKITTLAFQVHDGENNHPPCGPPSSPLCAPGFRQVPEDLATSCSNFPSLFNPSYSPPSTPWGICSLNVLKYSLREQWVLCLCLQCLKICDSL